MRTYTVVIERCPETHFLVGYIPCLPGASAQGATEEELLANLREILALLFADGEPPTAGEFVGTRTLTLGDP
jgi:predicted RNase H-like HicB family nuclease